MAAVCTLSIDSSKFSNSSAILKTKNDIWSDMLKTKPQIYLCTLLNLNCKLKKHEFEVLIIFRSSVLAPISHILVLLNVSLPSPSKACESQPIDIFESPPALHNVVINRDALLPQ